MGESATFRSEDRAGLTVAVVLHVAVVALLVFQPVRQEVFSAPERMTVNLASEVSLESTAPDPVLESRAALAPTLGEEVVPESDPVATESVPEIAPETPPPPTTSAPRAQQTAAPRQNTRTPPQPRATPSPRPTNRGGSRIGSDFLPGQGGSTTTDETRLPASEIGASAKASIIQSIVRQVRPHWNAPQGVDAERLVTVLAFELDERGRLKGKPRVINQSGINSSNRPQAPLHAERAIRAVQLAAPFDLPDEYYNAWKSIRGARFDRNLSR